MLEWRRSKQHRFRKKKRKERKEKGKRPNRVDMQSEKVSNIEIRACWKDGNALPEPKIPIKCIM